jgi:hypothetical protein
VKRLAVLAVTAVVVAACGTGDDLAGELLGVVAVVELPASELVQVGRDIPGEVQAPDAEARLEVVEIPEGARLVPTFDDNPIALPILAVRDPLGMGSLAARLDGSDRVLVLVSPLLVPTRGEIDYSIRLVAMAGGVVVSADWSDDATERLAGILDGEADPVEVLVRTVGVLADDQLGRPVSEEDQQLVDAVEG